MSQSYWSQVNSTRQSRRRVLTFAGGGIAGAAFLAACGGGSDSKSKTDDAKSSSLVAKPEDTSKQAKRGGTVKLSFGAEPTTLDPFPENLINLNTLKAWAYSNLIVDKPGYMKPPDFKEYVGEVAESWEFSPDKLTMTIKLRQGVKFHNKAPVNGRAMDSSDVVFSWNRFGSVGAIKSQFLNSLNPRAPITSLTATDARTVVIKTAFPAVDLMPLLASPNSGGFAVMPKEAEGGFNAKAEMIGTGPFMLDTYRPSAGMTWKRHADYHDKNRPYIDQIDLPFVPDYSTSIAQFQAGAIWAYAAMKRGDVLAQKQRTPELTMVETLPISFGSGHIQYGWQPAGRSPFRDERVRQACSYAIDRDLYIETFSEAKLFEAAGIPVQRMWASAASPGHGAWWLDPKSKDFGPNAKYYQHDVAEGKKLMAAAGLSGGLDLKAYRILQGIYGPDYFNMTAVQNQMLLDIGIKTSEVPLDYATAYIPQIRDGNGKFEGLGHSQRGTPAHDAVAATSALYHSKSFDWLGYDINGRGDGSGDPKVDADLEKMRAEFDGTKRLAMYHDLQRYLAPKQYGMTRAGVSQNFYVAWPVLKNFMVEQGDYARNGQNNGGGTEGATNWWIDDTQPPLKRT